MSLGALAAVAQPKPDLRLTLADSPDPVSVGELLTYRASVTNAGSADATGVSLVSTLSSNLTFFSATISQGTFAQSPGVVTCSLGTLAAGAGASVTIVATPGSFGTATNSAVVTETETDLNAADNSAVATTLVVPLTFYPGPSLNVARAYHTATLLPDGKVLIAGGTVSGPQTINPGASAEIYDPAMKTFTLTGSMNVGRDAHAATLLNDGTVLMTGGYTLGSLYSAELYNPATAAFTSVSNMNYAHLYHTATLLQDGRVLVEGDSYTYPANGAELYLPGSHSFTNIPGTINGATYRSAFRLANGKVILPGGSQNNGFNSLTASEFYDPGLNQFVALPDLIHPRCIYGCVQMLDGRYFIAGGNASPQTAEYFDPTAMNFTAITNTMGGIHYFAAANRLPDGKALVTGWSTQSDLFDPATGKFSRAVDMLVPREFYTATTLQDGTVLIVGGTAQGGYPGGPYFATTEIYDPARTKAPPSVSIGNVTLAEGNTGTTNAVFNLTLSTAMGVPVSVDFATGDNSAVGGTDYVATNGTVFFAPGTTNQTVTVAVIGNWNYEPDKSFFVSLSNPTNVVIEAPTGTGTILNDDPIPTATVIAAAVVKPNVHPTNFVINVVLSAWSYQPIWVNYATSDGTATAGLDYLATNGLLTFNPGQTNLTVTVPVLGNTFYESNKVFNLVLSSPTNVLIGTLGLETIISLNGLPGVLDHFTFNAIYATQYATVPIPITLTARDASNNVVTSFNGSVTLAGNSSNAPGYLFDFEEGDFSQWTPLNLGNSPGPYQIVPFDVPGHGAPSLAFRILPNSGAADGITRPVALQANTIYQISADIASINEGGGLNGDAGTAHLLLNSQEIATFNFNVFGYSSSTIFRTNLYAIFTPPADGTYQLSLRFDRGYGESGVANYADNVRVISPPLAPLWLSPFTNGVWAGNLIAGANTPSLTLHADDGDGHFGDSTAFALQSYADVAVQTSIAPGTPRVGTNLTFNILVSNSGPGAAPGIVVTNGLPPNSTFVSAGSTAGSCFVSNGIVFCNVGMLPSGQSATVTIVTVPFLPGTFTNVSGAWSAGYDPNVTNNLASAVVTVNPPLIYVSSPTVVERTGTTTNAQFQVRIATPFTQTIAVDYATATDGQSATPATAGLDYLPVSGHLTFAPGVTNQTVTVAVLDDLINEPTETFLLTLSNPINAQIGANGTCSIIDNFDPVPLISIADAAVFEGNSGTTNCVFNVTLDRPSGYTVRVNFATFSGTAIVGSDFITNGGSLSIPPNTTNATIAVAVRGDTVKEPDETFFVVLSSPLNAVIQRAQATGTILNDDTAAGQYDHLDWSVVPSPQYANLIFPVTLTARDAYGSPFTGAIPNTVNLTVFQNGTNFSTVSPSTVAAGSFVNGVWSGTISISAARTNVVLRADDGQQHVGASNPLDVLGQTALVLTLPVGTNENAGVWANAGKVSLPRATGSPVTVNLSSSDATEVTVPASVIVSAGQSNATFNLTLVDDTLLDGTQTATITASASGYTTATAPFSVYDNETATLSVSAPSTVVENAGSVQGTVTISSPPDTAMSVTMSSSDPNRIQVPASVSFSAGQTTKSFTITVVNDQILQGAPTNITITAHVQNWTDGTATLSLFDDETNGLAFQFTGGGAIYPEGTLLVTNASIRLGGSVSSNVTVNLASSDTSAVIVPASVVIPAGSNSMPLNLTIVDNTLTDGTHFATLTATASGFSNATVQVSVTDNDLHHFDFSAISSPQQGSVAFAVTLTARDVNDVLMTPYSSYVTLTAQDALGNPAPVSPSSVTVLNGQWSGSVTIPTWEYSGVRITATDTDGHSSTGGTFDLVAPTVFIATLNHADIAYSPAAKLLYASSTTANTLTPINPFSGAVGTPIAITNAAGTALGGRLCAADGGQYIFAVLNGPTNHICQFDVNSQNVLGWTLGGMTVSDLTPVLGSPAAVAVSWRNGNGSPHYGGVYIYDNGIARGNAFTGFLGADLIESSRVTNILYGYDNESSPSSTYVLNVDVSGVTAVGNWGGMGSFSVDFMCRAGLIFANTGQIIDPTRSLQIGSFANTPVSDDAPSGRYYLATAGALTAYDQNTLLPIGVTALPGVTAATGGFQRFGTNGFALRVGTTKVALIRTPLISTGPAADLRLAASVPASPALAGNVVSYTLTVSNLGPNAAQNVLLSQTLPANATFMSASSSSGSNTLSGGGLLSSLLAIPAGGNASVTVNLQTLKPGLLYSVASVTSDALDPNLTNNVLKLNVPVAAPSVRDSVVEAYLPTTDIAWDKFSGRIFASVPNSDWLLGNNLLALDPATGNYDSAVASVGLDPGKLAVADNGQYLYAGVNSDGSIQRVTLSSRTVDLKFPTGFGAVADMAALPGTPQSVAVTAHTTFAVYDNGVMRPNTVGPSPYNYDYYLAVSDTNTLAYEGLPTELRRIGIDASGATLLTSSGLISGFDRLIKFDAGRLYTAGGSVIDPEAQVLVTNLNYGGLSCPDSHGGKAFYLTVSGSTGTLHAVNLLNFAEVGSVTIPNVSGSISSLIRWGVDGLAFRTSANQLFLVRTTFADDTDNDGLADSWEMANFGSLNAVGGNPGDDFDHDGMSNYAEFRAGTDPKDPNSNLRLTGIGWQGNGIQLNWQGGTNVFYRIQRSQTLDGSTGWQDIFTNQPGTSTVGAYFDASAPSGASFYRIWVP